MIKKVNSLLCIFYHNENVIRTYCSFHPEPPPRPPAFFRVFTPLSLSPIRASGWDSLLLWMAVSHRPETIARRFLGSNQDPSPRSQSPLPTKKLAVPEALSGVL